MTSNLTIGTEFLHSWARSDTAAFSDYLAPQLDFRSPRARLTDQAAIEAMAEFSRVVSSVDVISAAENGEDVLVLYDMHTAPFGTIRTLDHYRVVDGRIAALEVLFDTAALEAERA